jgi:hypothetical protein
LEIRDENDQRQTYAYKMTASLIPEYIFEDECTIVFEYRNGMDIRTLEIFYQRETLEIEDIIVNTGDYLKRKPIEETDFSFFKEKIAECLVENKLFFLLLEQGNKKIIDIGK